MAKVELCNINKRYPDGFHAIKDLNIEVADEEFLILVGPSGCGKSTALRMIAGLEDVSDGAIRIGGQNVVDMAPRDRDIAMVFQNYALYPHMSVYDNIGFSMRLARIRKAEIKERVHKVAKVLELEKLLQRKPSNLSGGQRQRVAMGRAMVRQPAAFLMDEPLSNLDAKLRVQMRAEISQLQRKLGITTIYVTHDQTEAMTMGDRVAVLKDGVLQQIDTPRNLYNQPVNVFVAGFIGSPSMNLFEGVFADAHLHFADTSIPVPMSILRKSRDLADYNHRTIIFGIRPEHLFDGTSAGHCELPSVPVTYTTIEELGAERIAHLRFEAKAVDSGDPDAMGEFSTASNAIARFSEESRVRGGETASIYLDNTRLHFFDPDTHLAIQGESRLSKTTAHSVAGGGTEVH
jgi:multiple sugar transport system ATP-binding protein